MHQGLDGSRYQLIDVLGGEVEGDLWRMLRMSGDAAKMKSRIGVMVWKVARGDEGEGQPSVLSNKSRRSGML